MHRGGFLRSKIARRIFALFIICALLPVGVLTYFTFVQISGQLQEEADHRLHQRSNAIGAATKDRLSQLEVDLQGICEELSHHHADANLGAITENAQWNTQYMFQGLLLLDSESRVISHLNATSPLINLSAPELDHIRTGKTLLLTQSHPDSEASILIARALTPRHADSAILVGEINPVHFWQSVAQRDEFEIHIFDHHGRLVHTTLPRVDPSIPLRSASLGTNMSLRWESGEHAYQAYSWQLSMLSHFLDEWTFLLSQNETKVLGAMQNLRRNFILVTLLSFLLVGLVSSQLIRRSMTPILRLRAATDRISAEDFDVRVKVTSNDELGELGNAFNEMVHRLHEYRCEREQNEQDLLDACTNALRSATIESQFLANVSHELRTPITSIRSFAELLEEYGDEHTETRAEFLGIIVAESDRLMRLIEDILDFSKISSGSLRMDYQHGQIQETIESVIKSLQPLANHNCTIMSLEVDGELPKTWFDRDRITQVWTNLISNAIKFSLPTDDKIRIIAKVVNQRIEVSVSDEGPGIRAEDQEFIFQRFRQVSTDMITDKPNGTGLGLTIANDIVSYHEGYITVESTEGEGATFRVSLPILDRPPELKGPPPSSETEMYLPQTV